MWYVFCRTSDKKMTTVNFLYPDGFSRNQSTNNVFVNETNKKKIMKPELVERAKIPSVPVSIATFLQKYKETTVEQVKQPAIKKKGRCVTFVLAKNSSTTIKCNSYYSFVCKYLVKITYTCEKCQMNLGDAENQ